MALLESHIKNKVGIRIGVLNVNGLGEHDKQFKIFDQMKRDLVDIFVLVDTRLSEADKKTTKIPEIRNAHMSDGSGAGRGVLITAREGLDVVFDNPTPSQDGNKLTIDVSNPQCEDFSLSGIYGPTEDNVDFFKQIIDSMIITTKNCITTGDFNVKIDPALDIRPPRHDQIPDKKASFLESKIDDGCVEDTFRAFHPEKKAFSYRHFRFKKRKVPYKDWHESRIDLTLNSPEFRHNINNIQASAVTSLTMMPNLLICRVVTLKKQ